jgi:opacity protein-like surface antigen
VKSLLLASIVAFSVLSAAVAADHRAEIAATVDQFCTWTGLKRVSELRDIGYWKTLHDSGGNARFDLLVDGNPSQYRLIFFWQHGRAKIYSIEPDNYDWHGHGIGFDTLKDPKIRERAEAAAKKVNAHLKWKYAFGPQIQRIGRDIAVTYETVSHEEQKRLNYSYVDPIRHVSRFPERNCVRSIHEFMITNSSNQRPVSVASVPRRYD